MRNQKASRAAAAYFEHSDRGSSGGTKQEFNKRVGRPLALTHGLTIKQGSDRFDSNSHGRSAAESGAEDLPDSRVLTRAQMNARNGKKPNPAGIRKPTPRKGKTIVLGGKGAVESRLSNDTRINLGGMMGMAKEHMKKWMSSDAGKEMMNGNLGGQCGGNPEEMMKKFMGSMMADKLNVTMVTKKPQGKSQCPTVVTE